jgi:tetratricopeptide (TPR) repeat protein
MENLFFLKAEIVLFVISLLYILYYFWDRIFAVFLKIKKSVSPIKWEKKLLISKRKTLLNNKKEELISPSEWSEEVLTTPKEDPIILNKESTTKKEKLTDEEKQAIIEILKKIKVHVVKWYFDSARALIIEGLAIDKFNKDLNMNLASIYEKEKKFQNAEYIYRDLSEVLKDDFEVKKKLWFNLAMQSKLEEALEIYEQAHKQKKSDNEIVSMLTDLTYDMKKYKECLQYVGLFLKEKPRDVEKMFMKCVCLESLSSWDEKAINEVISVYKKILELQPYNTMARDRLKKLDSQLKNIPSPKK